MKFYMNHAQYYKMMALDATRRVREQVGREGLHGLHIDVMMIERCLHCLSNMVENPKPVPLAVAYNLSDMKHTLTKLGYQIMKHKDTEAKATWDELMAIVNRPDWHADSTRE